VATGKVIRFDEVRGYGFIAPDHGGEDLFVHLNDLVEGRPQFRTGLRVSFEVADGDRGLKAVDVRLTDANQPVADPHPEVHPPGVVPGSPTLARQSVDSSPEDGLCDLLSAHEFQHELTELLLAAAPTLTGEQILSVRRGVSQLAVKHNWVET
jgi:CspA family cold shock protein